MGIGELPDKIRKSFEDGVNSFVDTEMTPLMNDIPIFSGWGTFTPPLSKEFFAENTQPLFYRAKDTVKLPDIHADLEDFNLAIGELDEEQLTKLYRKN